MRIKNISTSVLVIGDLNVKLNPSDVIDVNTMKACSSIELGSLIASNKIIVIQQSTSPAETYFDTFVKTESTEAHNDLPGLQGGAAGEYYHLISAHRTGLTGGANTTLHSHAAGTPAAHASTHVGGSDSIVLAGATDGLMLAADKTKLDAVPTPANIVVTSDPRLSNARTPTTHASTHVGGSDAIALAGATDGLMLAADKTKLDAVPTPANIVVTTDLRLSDTRTPNAHASTHVGGVDAIAVAGATDGLMLAADKTKLDGIEANAQVNNFTYTPGTSGDWAAPAPTDIFAAIDRLAAVVKVLNGGTGA